MSIYHSLRILSELAEIRRFNPGRTNKAFTKSECAWVVDSSCFVCGHASGANSDGESLFRYTSVSQTLIVWRAVSTVKLGTRIRYVDTLSHEPVIMIFPSLDPKILSMKAKVVRGAWWHLNVEIVLFVWVHVSLHRVGRKTK